MADTEQNSDDAIAAWSNQRSIDKETPIFSVPDGPKAAKEPTSDDVIDFMKKQKNDDMSNLFNIDNDPNSTKAPGINEQIELLTTPKPTSSEVKDYSRKANDDVPLIDSDWVTTTLMVNNQFLKDEYRRGRFTSLTDEQFEDTTLGGSVSMNVPPQFTIFADPRAGGIVSGRNTTKVNGLNSNTGLGRVFGETIMENSTNVYFELGKLKHNNVIFYLLSAVDYNTAVIANTGRSPLAYKAGQIFGTGALMIAFPLITIGAIIAKNVIGLATNLLASPGRFAHNYLNPTMHDFWATAGSILTMITNELGMTTPSLKSDVAADDKKIGAPLQIDDNELAAVRKMMPGLLTSRNSVNIHAMVARGQLLQSKNRENRLRAISAMDASDFTGSDFSLYKIPVTELDTKLATNKLSGDLHKTLEPELKDHPDYINLSMPKDVEDFISTLNTDVDKVKDVFKADGAGRVTREGRREDQQSYIEKAMQTASAVFNEGARYAVFQVEHMGSSSITFNNSTTTLGLNEQINSAGSGWRELSFNVGKGEIPFVSKALTAMKDFSLGILDGITLGFSDSVAGYLAGANLHPEMKWEDSSVSVPTTTLKIALRSPSAHPISQIRGLYAPLASILAMVSPLSTGPASYTSPFHCSMFARGQQRIDRGMIVSATIERGVSNLAYNKQRRTMAIDVTLEVADFSQMVAAPVASSLLSTGGVMYDHESGMSKYIQALTARDLYSSTHALSRAKLKLSAFLQEKDLMLSPEYWGAAVGDNLTNSAIFSAISDPKEVPYSELF